MKSLVLSVVVLVICYWVQKWSPVLAGLLAVVPVKIVGTAMMAAEQGGREALTRSLGGMIVGQAVVLVALIAALMLVRRGP